MDLAAFEREALKMIETGGYEQAVTQLVRLSELIDAIVLRLRKKLPRKAREIDAKLQERASSASARRSASTDPAAVNRLSAPKKVKDPPAEPEHKPALNVAGGKRSRAGSEVARAPLAAGAGSVVEFSPWSEEDGVNSRPPTAGTNRAGAAGDRENTLRYQVTHLDARLKKAEATAQAKSELARKATTEIQRLERALEARDEKLAALKTALRQVHKEAQLQAEKAERDAKNSAAGGATGADRTAQLENELRKRASIVTQQEISIEKWQAKAKALECKNRLLAEQQKKQKLEREEEGVISGTDARKTAALEASVAAQKEKLRATKEALQFMTEELEARETEVAQLRVAQAVSKEESVAWLEEKSKVEKSVKHSSTALRNVLDERENTQAQLLEEIQAVEQSSEAHIRDVEHDNRKLRAKLNKRSSELNALKRQHGMASRRGSSGSSDGGSYRGSLDGAGGRLQPALLQHSTAPGYGVRAEEEDGNMSC